MDVFFLFLFLFLCIQDSSIFAAFFDSLFKGITGNKPYLSLYFRIVGTYIVLSLLCIPYKVANLRISTVIITAYPPFPIAEHHGLACPSPFCITAAPARSPHPQPADQPPRLRCPEEARCVHHGGGESFQAKPTPTGNPTNPCPQPATPSAPTVARTVSSSSIPPRYVHPPSTTHHYPALHRTAANRTGSQLHT